MESVPRDIALKLCDEIQAWNHEHRLSLSALRCLGCIAYSGVEPDIEPPDALVVCEAICQRYAEMQGVERSGPEGQPVR